MPKFRWSKVTALFFFPDIIYPLVILWHEYLGHPFAGFKTTLQLLRFSVLISLANNTKTHDN